MLYKGASCKDRSVFAREELIHYAVPPIRCAKKKVSLRISIQELDDLKQSRSGVCIISRAAD
jgi:hypothetical protein